MNLKNSHPEKEDFMTTYAKFQLAAVCCLAGMAIGGCVVAEPSKPDPTGLKAVDPCSLLSESELVERGLSMPGIPNGDISSEPGCDFDGEPFALSVYKNQKMTVERYGSQPNWATFERRELDGRPAANTIDRSAIKSRICSTMFDAGGGVIIVTVQETNNEGHDECAESWQVAELIADGAPR